MGAEGGGGQGPQRGPGPPAARGLRAPAYLAGGVHSEFLQFLGPRSGAQLSLLHGDPGRATASRSFGRARRSHSRGRPASARARRGGGGGTRGALRGCGRQRGGWGRQRPGPGPCPAAARPGPASLGHAAPEHGRRRRVSGAAAAARVSPRAPGVGSARPSPTPSRPAPTPLPAPRARPPARPPRAAPRAPLAPARPAR